MKRKIFLPIVCLGLGFCFYLISCTKGFEKLNMDPARPTEVTPSSIITGIEKTASDILYSTPVGGLVGMLYAQYWAQTQNESQTQYQLDENSTNQLWRSYSIPLSNIQELIRINEKNPGPGSKNQNAIAEILGVWIFHCLTDAYGNIPYSQALKGQELILTSPYDDSRNVYEALIQKLDLQIQALDAAAPSFSTGDIIYNGNPAKWKMLANSLKVRIGLRMSEANAGGAKQIIQNAVSGVFQSVADEAKFAYLPNPPDQFPVNDFATTQNQNFVSSTLINYLIETNDPRLSAYADPAAATGTFKGKPYGLGAFTDINEYSLPSRKAFSASFPGFIMSYSELQFALAEAVEREYITGDAEAYFENGVRSSMKFWGVSDADIQTYLDNNPYDPAKWKDVIGTQKWLSLYNQGLQGWFERNRLNFNKPDGSAFFIAPTTILDPSVTFVPFRMRYPISEKSTNRTNYEAAAQAIGGDKLGTKLWWQP